MCNSAPFLRRSDIYDFGYCAKIGTVPDLETLPVSQQEEAPDGERSNLAFGSEHRANSLKGRPGTKRFPP